MRRRTRPRTSRRTPRTCRVLAPLLGAGLLLGTATACVADRTPPPRGFPEAAVDEATLPASPSAKPAAAPALTDARARSALLRQGDLGGAWSGTQGAATWRDGLLKGRTDPAECQELLDAFYAEDLLGTPRGGRAVTGFDDDEYGSQLRYQVGAYDKAQIDERLDHFRKLAGECREFTVTGFGDREYGAEVTPVDLPRGIGDARQGLRLVVRGDIGGEEGALTLDLAAVRVGDTAVLLTHGGLYGIDDDTTREAARAGAERLQQVLAEKETKKGETKKGEPKKGEKGTRAPGRDEEGTGREGSGERGESPDESTGTARDDATDDTDGSAEEATGDGDTGSRDSSEADESGDSGGSDDSSDEYRDEARH
ncbi:hypothetical protein [Streptomyces neyagawaensis]|uniref:hypothetical protein n=1 Tax=Streptomyces neyagawaensis TaxID=42238 RepID=UPI00201D2B18|nr:hypothetical protein [Streptomyces neyagawaensis]MCL6734651.1 hypothetical protein [Streptomyces neyagawaensis]MDE1682186.1 hypothetical protein [Streptomyces neyagawaensis]